MRTMLFHRNFRGFTGGHLKVWDYFNHVEAAGGWKATVCFSNESLWNKENPWFPGRDEVLPRWEPEKADALFLGGHDWRVIPSSERNRYSKPIINLIQHVHHADPAHPLTAFLSHRAVRICVSVEVRDAIEATGRVNGPTFVIPNGIDFDDLPPVISRSERPVNWLVCGLKEDRSALARALAERLRDEGSWGRVETLTKLLPRPAFLRALGDAQSVVLLPRATEGFYLPALEAMALETFVVCPDCVGNRSFCRDGVSALVPVHCDVNSLLAAMQRFRQHGKDAETMVENAASIAAQHTLAQERATFHELLAALPSLW